jgi:hypothetical protein
MSLSSLVLALAACATLAVPPAEAAGPRLLVDAAHLENYSTTGFTDHLKSLGWTVATNTVPLTSAVLADYDVLLVPPAYSGSLSAFSASEVSAVQGWVAQGQGLWLLHKVVSDPTGINSLAASFGVTFQNDVVSDAVDNTGPPHLAPLISDFDPHDVFDGVSAFGLYLGACMSVALPAQAIAFAGPHATSDACTGSIPVLATAYYGDGGRVVCLPDVLPMHPANWSVTTTDGDERLYVNIANWLAYEPTPVARATWGGIKSLYR